jgi:hypothetical protein
MDVTEVVVLAGSILLIGLVIWYFFGVRDR